MSTKESKSKTGFSAEEKAAMKERARELKAEERANRDRAAGEKQLLDKVAEMKGKDRALAKKVHKIVSDNAPDLWPKTWYGMPAYAREGKVVIYFQDAAKFSSRYATIGFTDLANIDKGDVWATSFALKELTAADEKKLAALVKRAVS